MASPYPVRVSASYPFRVMHRRAFRTIVAATRFCIRRAPHHGQEAAPHADARRARKRAVAQLRHRAQAPGQRQGLHGRPDGSAGNVLPHEEGLLEGRHGRRVRLWRRRDPALHRAEGRQGRAGVPRRRRVPHPARAAAGRHALRHQGAAQDGRHLGGARLGPDRLPRPVGRHHVPGRQDEQGAGRLRRLERARLRPGWRRPGGAHLDELRRRRALRAELLRRVARAPAGDQHLHRRHPPPGPALQVQVQVLGLPERLHELDPALGHGRHRHLARQHPHRRGTGAQVVRQARHERAGQRRDRRAARPRPSCSRSTRTSTRAPRSPA